MEGKNSNNDNKSNEENKREELPDSVVSTNLPFV